MRGPFQVPFSHPVFTIADKFYCNSLLSNVNWNHDEHKLGIIMPPLVWEPLPPPPIPSQATHIPMRHPFIGSVGRAGDQTTDQKIVSSFLLPTSLEASVVSTMGRRQKDRQKRCCVASEQASDRYKYRHSRLWRGMRAKEEQNSFDDGW